MLVDRWLILLGTASPATAAAYHPRGISEIDPPSYFPVLRPSQVPVWNTTVGASVSPPYLSTISVSSEPSAPSLAASEGAQHTSTTLSSATSSSTPPTSRSIKPSVTYPPLSQTLLTPSSPLWTSLPNTLDVTIEPTAGSSGVHIEDGAPQSTTYQAPYPMNGSTPLTQTERYPRPTGVILTSSSSNHSCNLANCTSLNTLCTVNVPSADIEWWYGATYASVMGTLTRFAPNITGAHGAYLTMVPNSQSDTFDVASAITSDSAWTEHVTYDSEYDYTWTDYIPYTITPSAATTSLVERNYIPVLPPGNSFPESDIVEYLQVPTFAASVPVGTVANSTSAVTSATPFAYFSAYEVEYKTNKTVTTETFNLVQPTAIEYAIDGIENSLSVSSTVPATWMQHIPQSTCVPGTIRGSVTVLVVIDLVYMYLPHVNPFIVHLESSVWGWGDDPPVIVAQATSTGPLRLLTLDSATSPTQGGGGIAGSENNPKPESSIVLPPVSTPGSGSGASKSPTPEQNAPGGQSVTNPSDHQSGGNPAVVTPRVTVGSIGPDPVVVGPSSIVIVGSQTIRPGAPAVTVGGTSVSVAPAATAIVINDRTSPLPIVANPGSPTQVVGIIGGSPVAVGPSSVIKVGSQTLRPGGGALIVNGSPVSLVPAGNAVIVGSMTTDGHIIGTKTSFLPSVIFPTEATEPWIGPAPPIITIGSSTLTANAATQFFIAPGQTLTPGGTATVGGQIVSLESAAAFIVIAGSTQALPILLPAHATPPPLTISNSVVNALPGTGTTYMFGPQALTPGGVITVDGTTVSLSPSNNALVINGVTSTLEDPVGAHTTPPPLTFNNDVYSLLPGAGTTYDIKGQLLTPGGAVTVDGTTIYLAPSATALVINGVTTTLDLQVVSTAVTIPPLLTIGTHTYTAASGGGTSFVIDGQTLTMGGTIIVNGTTISLASGATELVYGAAGHSTTSALFPATTTNGIRTTDASASAGPTGHNGAVAPTTSTRGSAHSLLPLSSVWTWVSPVFISLISILLL